VAAVVPEEQIEKENYVVSPRAIGSRARAARSTDRGLQQRRDGALDSTQADGYGALGRTQADRHAALAAGHYASRAADHQAAGRYASRAAGHHARSPANPIPQGNGGDQDSDNNGGPSDGDGNI
jgi:hypothetical protein